MGIFKSASVLPITRSVVSQGLEGMFGDDPLKGFPSVKPKGGNDFDHIQKAIQPLQDMESRMKDKYKGMNEPDSAVSPAARAPKPVRQAIHILDGLVKQIETTPEANNNDRVLRYIQKIKEVLETGDYSY